jgi:hypothetical protein
MQLTTCPVAVTAMRRMMTLLALAAALAAGSFWPDGVAAQPGEFDVRVGPAGGPIAIAHDKVIPPIPAPKDSKYIRHECIQSEPLTKFWGRSMYLGANVLLPEGWDTHPEAKYPLFIFHGHFPYTIGGFRPEPPEPGLLPDFSPRFNVVGYNRIQQEYAHQFYKDWTGPGFPRGIGEGWAQFMYGGSTGGWEAMTVQMFHPDDFSGAYIACPDPIDFRACTVVNLYEDKNAYHVKSDWKKTPRPGLQWNGW